jgi:hypothetical protein
LYSIDRPVAVINPIQPFCDWVEELPEPNRPTVVKHEKHDRCTRILIHTICSGTEREAFPLAVVPCPEADSWRGLSSLAARCRSNPQRACTGGELAPDSQSVDMKGLSCEARRLFRSPPSRGRSPTPLAILCVASTCSLPSSHLKPHCTTDTCIAERRVHEGAHIRSQSPAAS